MEDVTGIEDILDEFLKEIALHPIFFIGSKTGFVTQDHYFQKFKITSPQLLELVYITHKDGYLRKSTQGEYEIVDVSLSLRGKEFLKLGGYAERKKKIKRQKRIEIYRGAVLTLLGVVAGSILQWALKEDQSDRPTEYNVYPTTIQQSSDTILQDTVVIHDTVWFEKK